MALTVAELNTVLTADIKDFEKGMDRATKDLKDFSQDSTKFFDKYGKSIESAGRKMTLFATVPIVGFLGNAVKGASDLNEAVSKTDQVFGASAASIHSWASAASNSIGLSQREAENAAGSFGNMFTQLDLGPEVAADMSKSIIGLAADFASFHNADISQVIEAQSAAFRGEYDSLQRFLPLINAATVEQRALELTGKATTSELTAQDKALAVNALMHEGAGKAAGDFARTSDGLANTQRTAAAEMQNVSDKLGKQLLPAVTSVAGFMSGTLLPTLDKLSGDNGALVLLGVAAAGPVLSNVVKLKDAIVGLNLTLDATVVKAAAALGAIGIVVAGVQQVKKDLEGGWAQGLLGSSPVSRFLDRTFHDGGVVPGPRGADVPIMAQAGEVVLQPGQLAALMSGGGGGGGGPMVVQLVADGRVIQEILLAHQRRSGSLGFN